MKDFYTSRFWGLIAIAIIALSISSCRGSRGGNNENRRERNSRSSTTINNINIINSTTNNNTYKQQQFNKITVQNIDNSVKEYAINTINNLTDNIENIIINNTKTNISVDKSIHQNFISQHIAQQVYNNNRTYNSRRRGDRYNFNKGDQVEINNINISGIKVSGLVAIVDDSKTYNNNIGIVLSYNSLQQIINQINNYNYSPRVGVSNYSENGDNNGSDDSFKGEGRHKNNADSPYAKPNVFKGTDPGGWNFLSIIGAIVIVLFFLWILSWFRR